MTSTLHRRRQNQRGFALLLVFLMASAVALMLYMQVPRAAFESERDKEQLLIDRGEQYKRAIYVYYISNNRQWPSKIEDLESTNGHRYLRERFVDPYTGKNEWRLVHTNGAFLTDSLVTPPPAQATPNGSQPGGPVQPGGALAGTGGAAPASGFTVNSALASTAAPGSATDPNAPPAVNATVQRRASDNTMVQNSNFQNIAGGGPATPNNDPGYQPFNAAALPPITMYPNGYGAAPVNAPGMLGAPQGTLNPNGPQQAATNPGAVNFGNMLNQINNGNPTGANPVNPNGINPNGAFQPGGANPGGFGNTSPTGTTQVGTPGFNVPGTNFASTNPGFSLPTPTANGFGSSAPANPQPAPNSPFGGVQSAFNSDPNANTQPFGSQAFAGAQPFGGGPAGGVVGAPPGVPGIPGGAGAAANNQAVNLINQLLTQPRQPPAGIGPNQQPAAGGGLAGVASTYKGATIKSYGDRTKYQEWEFVFQLQAQGNATGLQAPGQGPNGSGGIPNGGPLSPSSPGGPGAGQTPGFGSSSASPFGGSSTSGAGGFGSTGFGTPPAGGGNATAPNSPFGLGH